MSRNLTMLALCAGSLSASMLPGPAVAQDSGGIEVAGDRTTSRIAPRFGIDFNTPRNGDDGRSFGRASAFFPLFQVRDRHLTFLNTSARLDSASRLGGSVSLGHRLAVKDSMLLGGYVAYDVRDTGNQVFNQLGVGAEVFGEGWQASVNGYIPVGASSVRVGEASSGQALNSFFQGNQLLLSTGGLQEFESALGGVDVGAGVRLADFDEYGELWGQGKVYTLAESIGGSVQLDHRVANRFRVGLGAQSDGVFGTQVFFSVGASVGGKGSRQPEATVWAQADRDIRRNNSIVVRSEMRGVPNETTVAVNPETGEAYRFRHVAPDAANATQGEGSVEGPFTTLGTGAGDSDNTALRGASEGEIVYVSAGDSRTNNLTPFTIPAGVQVYSDASTQPIATQLGDVGLPMSGTGLRPLVDGGGATGITLNGSNSLISGFEVTNAQTGILASGADGVVIQNNIASNNSQAGISLSNLSGAVIQNNEVIDNQTRDFGLDAIPPAGISLAEVTGTVSIAGNTVMGTQVGPNPGTEALEGQGIALANASGTVDLTIDNNTVSGNEGDGIGVGLTDRAEGSFAITNNTIQNNGGTEPLRGDGIKVAGEVFSSILDLTITGNTVTDNIDDGIDVNVNQVTPGAATVVNVEIRDNTITGSVNGQGVILRNNQSGYLQAVVENNTINNNSSDGFRAESNGTFSRFCLALTDNTSNDGFQLSKIESNTFLVIDLDNISVINEGTVNLSPNRESFTSVPPQIEPCNFIQND